MLQSEVFKRKEPRVFNVATFILILADEFLYVYDLYTGARGAARLECSLSLFILFLFSQMWLCLGFSLATVIFWPFLCLSSSLPTTVSSCPRFDAEPSPHLLSSPKSKRQPVNPIFLALVDVILAGLLTWWMRNYIMGMLGTTTEEEEEAEELEWQKKRQMLIQMGRTVQP